MEAGFTRAHAASKRAVKASTIKALKFDVDAVLSEIWGIPAGISDSRGAAAVHGWKTRWQTSYDKFDPAFGERYGNRPPTIIRVDELGIVGRGRHIRRVISSEKQPNADEPIGRFLISLNNVIGWTRLDDGVTKAERQPRIDLTYRWDADNSFWLGTADTGWIFEVQAQALNILKSDYAELEDAQAHARDLLFLLKKCVSGQDLNNDGAINAIEAEGGFAIALAAASEANL